MDQNVKNWQYDFLQTFRVRSECFAALLQEQVCDILVVRPTQNKTEGQGSEGDCYFRVCNSIAQLMRSGKTLTANKGRFLVAFFQQRLYKNLDRRLDTAEYSACITAKVSGVGVLTDTVA